ncbi:MAG: hypothetical protein ACI4PL_03115 [Faecousia sp.]
MVNRRCAVRILKACWFVNPDSRGSQVTLYWTLACLRLEERTEFYT